MPHPDTEQVASAKKAAAIKASNAARVKAAALRSTPGLTADDPRLATLTTCRSSHDQQHVHGARAPPQRRGDELDVWLTFTDLKRAGVVDSWQTLLRWQNDPRVDFPKGRLFGPNSRRWSKQREIDPWLESRPIERDAFEDAASDMEREPL